MQKNANTEADFCQYRTVFAQAAEVDCRLGRWRHADFRHPGRRLKSHDKPHYRCQSLGRTHAHLRRVPCSRRYFSNSAASRPSGMYPRSTTHRAVARRSSWLRILGSRIVWPSILRPYQDDSDDGRGPSSLAAGAPRRSSHRDLPSASRPTVRAWRSHEALKAFQYGGSKEPA